MRGGEGAANGETVAACVQGRAHSGAHQGLHHTRYLIIWLPERFSQFNLPLPLKGQRMGSREKVANI